MGQWRRPLVALSACALDLPHSTSDLVWRCRCQVCEAAPANSFAPPVCDALPQFKSSMTPLEPVRTILNKASGRGVCLCRTYRHVLQSDTCSVAPTSPYPTTATRKQLAEVGKTYTRMGRGTLVGRGREEPGTTRNPAGGVQGAGSVQGIYKALHRPQHYISSSWESLSHDRLAKQPPHNTNTFVPPARCAAAALPWGAVDGLELPAACTRSQQRPCSRPGALNQKLYSSRPAAPPAPH